MPEEHDPRELDRDLALAKAEHRRLLDALDALVEADSLDMAAPSALPGWTCGHVLTHITNSGDGHAGIFDAAAEGRIAQQYPGGVEGRAADIETGSTRSAVEQLASLRQSIANLEERWDASDWQGSGIGPAGEVALKDLPFFRIREVAIHHVDLDIGYTFADLQPEYVRLELWRMGMLWKARQPMGMTELPAQALQATPGVRLGWLMGRSEIDGLEPARVF
ncbi:MAG: maleylpyruvate isomerase family mycothiol-dependent enzyme [Actinobacteria bacterium]|nr:maleylpyruvate isomerase family mycothiol-dependent enzyme [Actinomycetota bacterium]